MLKHAVLSGGMPISRAYSALPLARYFKAQTPMCFLCQSNPLPLKKSDSFRH